ncbi:COG4 transport family protein [Babesia bovis T2Bo]|uniref:Uncharacterized protein n=1 Tax=Babesia bovis TaxID=5865 RepID=A7ASS8_BABBO|nr:COG4 transport family protein [Babesia bovis T2Bo]EDO05989.1 COG4 transport family protein [Babesia bovis T2Bo]|eukprot:XP_001609557.1 hypothetical protein [Babesia bovis T2Bo]
MVDILKTLSNRLDSREVEIVDNLSLLETSATSLVEDCNARLQSCLISRVNLCLNENFDSTEDFSSRFVRAADTSACALDKLNCAVKVVDFVSVLYDFGWRILSSHKDGDHSGCKENIHSFIRTVDECKHEGYWDEVSKVLSRGYIDDVMRRLRCFVIEQLRGDLTSEQSQLYTRLAITLQARSEAYESYCKIVRMRMAEVCSKNQGSTVGVRLDGIIKCAGVLLLSQAQAVHNELGSSDYLRICREIHALTSAEACMIFRSFLISGFAPLIGDSNIDSDVDAVLSNIESSLSDDAIFFDYVSDMKTLDRVLDDIAYLSSLWCGYEASYQSIVSPIQRSMIGSIDFTPVGTDNVGSCTDATCILQSILSLYVRLENAAVTNSLNHAINSDAIYITSVDEGYVASTSTIVDDSFFVLQKAQHRAVSTGDVQAACATLNQVIAIIQGTLKGALVRNLLDSQNIYKVYLENPDNLVNYSWHKMLHEYFEHNKQDLPESVPSRFSFIHCVNNIEECFNFLSKFKTEISSCFTQEFSQQTNDKLLVESTLESLDAVMHDFHELLDMACKSALSILKYHIFEPLNAFSSISFVIDEESYSLCMSENPFLENVSVTLRLVFGHLSTFYLSSSYLRCMETLTERICKFLEHSILDKHFTMYGAVYLDSIVRSLMHVCTSYEQNNRSQFATLLLITDVLNCGTHEETSHLYSQGSRELIDRYFSLRIDADINDVPTDT